MDSHEYNIIVRQWAPHLLRFVNGNMKNMDITKDIVQDTFEVLWTNRENVEHVKAKQYLFTVAYRKSMDVFRRNKHHAEINEQHQSIMGTENFDKAFSEKDLIGKAMTQLPDLQRQLLMLRDLEGYEYEEIEEITGLNANQARVYLFRARKLLKETITRMEAI